MRKLLLIGIGAGNPDFMTIQAIKALNRADVIFVPDKGAEKASLRALRTEICERFIEAKPYRTVVVSIPERAKATDYRATVDDWHAELARRYREIFASELGPGETGAFLVWGDPTLYDSLLRIVERVRTTGLSLDMEIIPGITSVQALSAAHGIPLNRIGEPVLITTGRRLAAGFPEDPGSVVVMLDGEQAFAKLDGADELDIYWGAYLGTPDEILVSGRLAEVSDEIEATRARERERHGWIMDTYLLRRSGEE